MTKWAGFPMGFRFIVPDFSAKTKRSCWSCLLSSLGSASYAQVLLFEAETVSAYDPCEKIYLCILSHKPIKQSRANTRHFQADPVLMSRLSVYAPMIQENTLNQDAPNATLIGLVKANGEIVCEDAGRDILLGIIPCRTPREASKTILVAPDSMKGMFSSTVLAYRIGTAIADRGSDYLPRLLPVGDGGEGTMLALAAGMHARILPTSCRDAAGTPTSSAFAVLPDGSAVVECAKSIGYAQRGNGSIFDRSSGGVGDLILRAVGHGYSQIIVCVGGTSTCDCGIGMLHALGFRFYDAGGTELEPTARNLGKVSLADDSAVPDAVRSANFTVLVDSANPLLGDDGAVRVYAPQKGAAVEDVNTLESGFSQFSSVLQHASFSTPSQESNGAGGGIAFALACTLGAKLMHGIDYVLDAIGFARLLEDANAVITAEGCFDLQSIQFGKATKAIIERCENAQIPCLLLAGRTDEKAAAWVREHCRYTSVYLCDCSEGEKEEKLHAGISRMLDALN